MAELTPAQVRAIARLARLRFDAAHLERLRGDLARILDHVSALASLDLDGIEPTAHVLEMTGGGREDEPHPCLDRERVLAQAPDAAAGHFRVPRVLG
jgi:aspartyl-tRNA(Asn)/glutamyl-tRNA(Gln) amidotransferase subunit C